MKLSRNLGLVFLAFLMLATVSTFVNAQTTADVAKDNVKKNVDYALPYPGILPDNTLYPLKAFRDRVIEFLTIDPLKKAEFYLLQADKRLSSGEALFDKNNFVLGEQTISKGEKYFQRAFDQAQVAKTKGKDTRDLNDRMKRASIKHEEVINLLISRAPAQIKTGLVTSEETDKAIEDTFPVAPASSDSGETSPSAQPAD